jgi:hypothetical protein
MFHPSLMNAQRAGLAGLLIVLQSAGAAISVQPFGSAITFDTAGALFFRVRS